MNYKYTYESPLGTMIMLGTLTYLTDLFLVDESHAPTYDDAEYIEQLTGPFEVTIMWLDQYFKCQKPFLTFNTTCISGQFTITANYTMTWNDNGYRIMSYGTAHSLSRHFIFTLLFSYLFANSSIGCSFPIRYSL